MKKNKIKHITLYTMLMLTVMTLTAACGGIKAEIPNDYNYADLSEYIKLGDYKGLEYTKITGDVSDDDINDYIDDTLSGYSQIEQIREGVVEEDSVVNIDYVGSVDGVEFEGGSAQGVDLDIANSGYIPGFAEGIVGHEVGETFDLNVTFPEDYHSESLQGKDAVFKTTINYLVNTVKPEFNDEWVENNSDYKTVDEYKEHVKDTLSAQKLSSADSDEKREIRDQILNASEMIEYPETELASRTESIKKEYIDYASQNNMEFEEFLSSQGISEDQFNSMTEEYAKDLVFLELMLYAIKNQEGIEIKQSEYNDYLDETLTAAGFTKDDFEKQNGMSIEEYANDNNMFTSFLYNKVMDKVMEYSIAK